VRLASDDLAVTFIVVSHVCPAPIENWQYQSRNAGEIVSSAWLAESWLVEKGQVEKEQASGPRFRERKV